MFGLIWSLFTLSIAGIDKHNRISQNEENKKRAIKNGDLTYYGSRGNEYLVENDKWVYSKIDHNTGNDVIVDMKTGEVYYNLTETKKSQEIAKKKNKGKTVRTTVHGERIPSYYGKYKQLWGQIDIDTNIPVRNICINCVWFYQELEHGMVLRPIDDASFDNMVGKHTINELINLFNKRQKEMQNELELNKESSLWLSKNYFFNSNNIIYIDKFGKLNLFNTNYKEGRKALNDYIKADNN